jgi:sulfite reductase alpha subunit-like flavoprotein
MYNEVKVFYASETGTAEEAAYRIVELIISRGVNCTGFRAHSLNDFQKDIMGASEATGLPSVVPRRLVLFIVSTTGDGVPPNNMRAIWNFLLQKRLPNTLLANIEFGVFGLGDSSYEKYNAAARYSTFYHIYLLILFCTT